MSQICPERSAAIFDQDWWFDAVCPGAWDRHEIRRDGMLFASYSFHYFRKMGFRYVTMPGLTRTLEPYVAPRAGKPVSRMQFSTALLKELLGGMPDHDRFELCLPPESDLALPFSLIGYRNTATYTFRHDGVPLGAVWTGMEQKTRNMITTSRGRLEVESHADLDRYVRLAQGGIKTGGADKTDYAGIRRAFEACQLRDQCTILTAVDEHGRDAASVILIWDHRRLYYWMSARDKALSGNAANSLLVWHALEFATSMGCQFDLDGFITPQSGVFLSKFGLQPAIRHYITNVNPLWSGLAGLREIFRPAPTRVSYR
ncbi:MAG TPA: GNAT family N-acetyltransferase [Acidisoma sp.]|nr:GNAT family N-acetyltransferase [Acidisoma sp.]